MSTKLATKVDSTAWTKANHDHASATKGVYEIAINLKNEMNTKLATKVDIVDWEESKAKIVSDTDQAVNAITGKIDFTNKSLVETQENLHEVEADIRSSCADMVNVAMAGMRVVKKT